MEKVLDTFYNKEVKMKLIEWGYTENLEIYQYRNQKGAITSYWIYDTYFYQGKIYKKITPLSLKEYESLLEENTQKLSR